MEQIEVKQSEISRTLVHSDERFHRFGSYRVDGKPRASLEITIDGLAKYYNVHPDICKGENPMENWAHKGSGHNKYDDDHYTQDKCNEYMPYAVPRGNGSAGCFGFRHVIQNLWQFPESIKDQAERLTRNMIITFNQKGGNKMMRRQEKGRLDTGAMLRIVKDLRRGTFSVENTKPFKRKIEANIAKPKIAIVCQGNPEFFWSDPRNLPNAAAITLAVSWACQTLGLQFTSVMGTESLFDFKGLDKFNEKLENGARCSIFYVMHDYDFQATLKSYGIFFHRDFYRCAWISYTPAVPEIFKHRTGKDDMTQCASGDYTGNGSYDKTFYGTAWARDTRKADIVIAIGDFADASKADIHLSDIKQNLDKAMNQVIDKLIHLYQTKYRRAA